MRTHLSIVLLKSLIFHFRFHVHALCFFLQAREQTEKANFFNLANFYCLIFCCCGICLRLILDLIEPWAVRGVDVKSSWWVIGAKPVSKGKKYLPVINWRMFFWWSSMTSWFIQGSAEINQPTKLFFFRNTISDHETAFSPSNMWRVGDGMIVGPEGMKWGQIRRMNDGTQIIVL